MLLAHIGQELNKRSGDLAREFNRLASKLSSVRRGTVSSVRNSYDAGSTGTRRTMLWRAPTASPNAAILWNLPTLRDRSRDATRNDGYAKGAIDKLVTNIIGTGIKPLSQARDAAFRKEIQDLWLRWTDESDADGLLDWYGQQSQAVRGWLEGGEVFLRLRPRLAGDGLSVPLQIQVIEPELCPLDHSVVAANGNIIRAGIEFNRIGKRVAYWFHPSRPSIFDDFDASELRRVPAENVIHLYDPIRPGQLRGVPHLTQALIRLYEAGKMDDARLLREQLANLFVGFLKRPAKAADGQSIHPLTGLPIQTASTAVGEREIVPLEPGIWQELEDGEEVNFSDPPDPGSGYGDFMRQQLMHASAATGVPYEIWTGDMSKVNDRTVRVILTEFRRRIQSWQHQVVAFKVCRTVWKAWLDRAFLSDSIQIPVDYIANPEPWAKVKWMPQGWPYIHPVQDVQANKEANRCGYKSRSAIVSEQGDDAEEVDAEQAADNERADELGLKYDSDGRTSTSAAAAPPPPPEDTETPELEKEKSEVPA